MVELPTHFRHPTDEQLQQLDIYRSRTSDRGLQPRSQSLILPPDGASEKRDGSLLARSRGRKMRDLGNEVAWSVLFEFIG